MTTPRTPARRLPLLGVLAASALALAGCAGNGGAGASSTPGSATGSPAATASPPTASMSAASPSSSTSSPAGTASSSAAPTGSAAMGGSATPSGGSSSTALSLHMPAALDAEHMKAVKQAVQLSAGPGAEVGMDPTSPLERQTELRESAESLEQIAAAGATPAPSWSPEQRVCLDATRDAMTRSADVDAAWVTFTVQPPMAATLGGASTASPVPSMTASPKGEITPLGVNVEAFADADAARAEFERALAANKDCVGLEMANIGMEDVKDAAWEGGTAYTATPTGSGYSHLTAVQDGARIITVMQDDGEGGVPADAEKRAMSIVENVKTALDGK